MNAHHRLLSNQRRTGMYAPEFYAKPTLAISQAQPLAEPTSQQLAKPLSHSVQLTNGTDSPPASVGIGACFDSVRYDKPSGRWMICAATPITYAQPTVIQLARPSFYPIIGRLPGAKQLALSGHPKLSLPAPPKPPARESNSFWDSVRTFFRIS